MYQNTIIIDLVLYLVSVYLLKKTNILPTSLFCGALKSAK